MGRECHAETLERGVMTTNENILINGSEQVHLLDPRMSRWEFLSGYKYCSSM